MTVDFNPSILEGQALDYSVRDSFSSSVDWCFAYLQKFFNDLPSKPTQLGAANPAQIGLYFSLSTLLNNLSEDDLKKKSSDIRYFLDGLLGSFTLNPPLSQTSFDEIQITTLNNNYYSDDEISCLLKWFDVEPQHTIGLSGLSDEEMSLGSLKLEKALIFINKFIPMFYDELRSITRQIIIAKPSGNEKIYFGGVSSFALWGAICLNENHHHDWKSYIPSLIHEYSHNVLFAKAIDGPLVENPSSDLYHSPLRDSLRPMDGIYHAAFVSAREAVAANHASKHLEIKKFLNDDPEIVSFLHAMTHSSLTSFRECVRVIGSHAKLTELGYAILKKTKEAVDHSFSSTEPQFNPQLY